MSVVLDTAFLTMCLDPHMKVPLPGGSEITENEARERVNMLFERFDDVQTRVVVPAPALSEALVWAGELAAEWMSVVMEQSRFEVVPFDERAALEAALMTSTAISNGGKRGGLGGSWAKIKFDRQIAAIAKVENASVVYSTDGDMVRHLNDTDIEVMNCADLPSPSEGTQRKLDLEEPSSQGTPTPEASAKSSSQEESSAQETSVEPPSSAPHASNAPQEGSSQKGPRPDSNSAD